MLPLAQGVSYKAEQSLSSFLLARQEQRTVWPMLGGMGLRDYAAVFWWLGVRDVAAHNQALLCKFAAKVLQPSDIPCFQWFAAQYCSGRMGSGVNSRDTPIWKGFKCFIPMVLYASRGSLGNGCHLSFWHDKWLDAGRLFQVLPTLYTFAKDSHYSVASQLSVDGVWDIQLHPNLTRSAAQELHATSRACVGFP